ncbi:protein THALLO isoform X2 [Diospyros lotus]|uniref:protein THALLO isoform X2 n=1 Tax=Diospyros lotus TaxID=55363 RepID=UPI00225BEBFB|nr:protein THALLO isoform X2 [Diospyros lotus]
MGKEGKRGNRNPFKRRKSTHLEDVSVANSMMDDEIDAFHNQRDIVPLDINDDVEGSDEADEHPVLDFEDANDDEEDNENEDDDTEDDTQLTGLAAKIARQQKYLKSKIGGVEDEMQDDVEDDEEKKAVWGRRKNIYYSADNVDYELQSSDDELLAEEEAEVMRLQKERAKLLTMEDYGLEDVSLEESDGEPTLGEFMGKGKSKSKASLDKKAHIDPDVAYEKVEKDLNALSKEEQMDVVYSSAPELVGLLSELNYALEELENKVDPLISKVREGGDKKAGGMDYLEVKRLLLLAYCQAIIAYLLLKSEGFPVRNHPVIARLVEIKSLVDKMKQLDENLPSKLENMLSGRNQTENVAPKTDSSIHSVSFEKLEATILPHEAGQVLKVDSMKDNENKERKCKHLNDQVSKESAEMLKIRAALEEKLKQKGIFSSIASKPNRVNPDKVQSDRVQKHQKPINRQLETLDDFDDDATEPERGTHGMRKGNVSSPKLSQLITLHTQRNKPKVFSGDYDAPKRDDIGERRRKLELRVLARAGIKPTDDDEDEPSNMQMGNAEEPSSEDEFYQEVKQQRAERLAAKREKYSRPVAVPSVPEEIPENGKRPITYEMEKNRGLTRYRKKLTKNPRKKYKLKHQKAVVRRKGQVRDIRRPTGSYGGEASGINAGISRSIRFKY